LCFLSLGLLIDVPFDLTCVYLLQRNVGHTEGSAEELKHKEIRERKPNKEKSGKKREKKTRGKDSKHKENPNKNPDLHLSCRSRRRDIAQRQENEAKALNE